MPASLFLPRSAVRTTQAFVAFVCLLVLAGSAWLVWEARERELERARRDTVNLVESVAHYTTQSVREVESTLATVALRLGELEASGKDPSQLRPLLAMLAADLPALHELHVFGPGGRMLLHSGGGDAARLPGRDRDFFRFHREPGASGTHIGLPWRSPFTGEWVIPVSRRWDGPGGSFRGVIVGTLRMAHLNRFFARFKLGRAGLLAVNTANAQILARHPLAEGMLGADLSDSALNRLHYQKSLRGSFRARSPLDGVEREYSFAHLSDYPLMVVAALSTEEVLASWRAGALAQAGATLLLLLLLAGFGHHTLKATRREARLNAALSASHRRLQDLTRALDEHAIVAVTDVQGTILHANARFCEVSGYSEPELLGQNHRLVKADHHDADFFRSMWLTIAGGEVWKGEIRNRARDGHSYWVDSTIVPFLDEAGRPWQYISVGTDITAAKEAELMLEQSRQVLELACERLAEQASTDGLTGLANRRRFNQAFDEEFARARRSGLPLAVLMLDVDLFKSYNDSLGHPAGDECLKRVAEAIGRAIRRPGDLAARYGGEEFVVLLPNVDAAGALVVARNIRQKVTELALPHPRSPHGVVTVSVGVHALDAANAVPSAGALLAAADGALYAAKAAGRNRVRAHEPAAAQALLQGRPPG